MIWSSITLGAGEWLIYAISLGIVCTLAIVWSYARSSATPAIRISCATLKMLAIFAICLCLVEPLFTGIRSQPGANIFVVLVDNSQSLEIADSETGTKRSDWAKSLLEGNQPWRTRLSQDFDSRNYVFDTHLRGVEGFDEMRYDGTSSSLHTALAAVAKRYQGRPLAGILLLSDGNATDIDEINWANLPPVYPVIPPSQSIPKDLAIARVTLNQTNFETAPVALQTEVIALGFNEPVIVMLMDETGKEIERQQATPTSDKETLNFRFQLRPTKSGVGFYRVETRALSEAEKPKESSVEQTLANNARLVVVDRGGGPYRVLYVCGRPNWEFKYLRRALNEDSEVQLVGLVRVARKEPKFDFRNNRAQPNNPLFKGFEHPDSETAERYDQPVLIRLGTLDPSELRSGFPQTAADLYKYHAVILDDMESAFFTADQLTLLRNFVTRRGGGFLMLGGPDSFSSGRYDRTPVSELLPVYLDASRANESGTDLRLVLTREGWLQPWVRTRKTEEDENRRLSAMSSFQTLNLVGSAKPGATILAQVRNSSGREFPALVAQPFGKGRSAAMLIGDLWRWGLRREDPQQDDFDRSWRQTVRWLVADVPGRIEVQAQPNSGTASPTMEISVRANDPEYLPLDNATVSIKITRPNREVITLTAESDSQDAGRYVTKFVPREPGSYFAEATVTAPDGSVVGRREVGWCVQPEAEEFARLEPNRALLESIATRTQGEVIESNHLKDFVSDLPSRKAPNMEVWVSPLWHRSWYFLFALCCLVAEWGLRRRAALA